MHQMIRHKNMDKIAVLIPCYNEEKTIEKVVNDFKKVLPDYSAHPAHSGRSSAQPDRSSAHLIQSAVQPMLAADQHAC